MQKFEDCPWPRTEVRRRERPRPQCLRLEEFHAKVEAFLGKGRFTLEDAKVIFGLVCVSTRGLRP